MSILSDVAKSAHQPEAVCASRLGMLMLYILNTRFALVSDDGIIYQVAASIMSDGGNDAWQWSTGDGAIIASNIAADIAPYLSTDGINVFARWVQRMHVEKLTPADIIREYPDWFIAL